MSQDVAAHHVALNLACGYRLVAGVLAVSEQEVLTMFTALATAADQHQQCE